MAFASKRFLSSIVSLLLYLTITSVGLSQNSFASEKYKDLEIGQMFFSDVSSCLANTKDNYLGRVNQCVTRNPISDREGPQFPATVWAFSIKNKAKSAYTNVRAEIVFQNNTGADLYNNILLITSRIEPGETIWVAPDREKNPAQANFQGVTKGFAKIISAKKAQPQKYRIKGFAEGTIGSISDDIYKYYDSLYFASAVNGVFKDWARTVDITIPVAVDARKVPSQWITVLYKDPDGKILGGFKFPNEGTPPYSRTLYQDLSYLKRLVSIESYVSRR
jgi:hypothetical protein